MSHIRYFLIRDQESWSVRRDCKPLGSLLAEAEAVRTAVEAAAIDRVRGHVVEIVKLDVDGRWTPCARLHC